MSVSHEAKVCGNDVLPENLIHVLEQVWLEARQAVTLTALVMVVLRGVRGLGIAMLEQVLEERDRTFRQRGLEFKCPKCKGRMKKLKNRRKISRMTLLGRVTYRRCRYACRHCGHRVFPLDEQLSLKGLLRGHSDEFAKDVVLLCTIAPFGKGCELFERFYGVLVSTKLARALTVAIGKRLFEMEMKRANELWELRYKEPEQFEPLPARLRRMKRSQRTYVMMDNSKLGIQEGKRGRGAPKLKTLKKMAQQAKRKAIQKAKRGKAGPQQVVEEPPEAAFSEEESFKDVRALLIFHEEDLAKTGNKKRREILHRRVIAHVGTKEEWMRLVHMALHEEGVYVAHEVVIIADGGSGIWELFEELLPTTRFRKVIQVLDWYHAVSHLWKVGRALKGCKTEAQRKACIGWVEPLIDDLSKGKVANVLGRLRKLRPKSETAKDEVRKCIEYFDDHRKRMRYAWCRKQNISIGSGAIESVHAWVIQARCRLPGMRWSIEGANAMLRLRCAWASGRLDEEFASAAEAAPATDQNFKAAA
jgi:hypothetical protein